MKVNEELCIRIKKAIQSGDYTVREVADTLDWLRVEYIRKRTMAVNKIKVCEVETMPDWYDDMCHRKEDAPNLK